MLWALIYRTPTKMTKADNVQNDNLSGVMRSCLRCPRVRIVLKMGWADTGAFRWTYQLRNEIRQKGKYEPLRNVQLAIPGIGG
jgi:hypothetical protein